MTKVMRERTWWMGLGRTACHQLGEWSGPSGQFRPNLVEGLAKAGGC